VVYRNNKSAYFLSRIQRRAAMFLFNRSGLAVCLALVIAGLPVLIQYL
jgi:hypothetical protein